jgi:hypothetical protein
MSTREGMVTMASHGWKTLEKWIEDAMRDGDKQGKLSCLQLVVRVGMADRELHVKRFEPSDDCSPHVLAEMFHGKAMAYAQGIEGRQQFCLNAMYGGRAEVEAMHPFRVNPPADPNAGYATEEATLTGRTMQAMRHGEDMHAASKGFLQVVFNRQNQMDARSDERERLAMERERIFSQSIQALIQENLQAVEIVKKMTLMQMEADHRRAMELEEYRRKTTERAGWMKMAPPLANQLLGKEIFPQSVEDTAIVEGIADVFLANPEYLKMLEGVFPPEKLAPIVSRISRIQAERAKLEEEMKKLPHGNLESEVGSEMTTTNGSGNEHH